MLVLPALFFSMYAQMKIKSTFSKYLQVPSQTGLTGSQVARFILDKNGLYNVRVETVAGSLTDHYDPRTEVVRLSQNVYGGSSIAAVSVAAHEVGHAIQHANSYFPLSLRSALAPVASFGSRLVWVFIFIGMIISPFFIDIGIALFLGVVLFQIVTLPVEFNASKRALEQLEAGIIDEESARGSKKVLNAAALTYVAATIVALAELLRLLAIFNRKR
ncbi:MAG: zinc metallopeptidase [Gudongella oleilytica]|nr:zinc metallopeptidase [Gudongella oleilytica]MDY0256958.1 zinc metallopeptidase [Gudongella oleilytica]